MQSRDIKMRTHYGCQPMRTFCNQLLVNYNLWTDSMHRARNTRVFVRVFVCVGGCVCVSSCTILRVNLRAKQMSMSIPLTSQTKTCVRVCWRRVGRVHRKRHLEKTHHHLRQLAVSGQRGCECTRSISRFG